jgi:hypothetical protein
VNAAFAQDVEDLRRGATAFGTRVKCQGDDAGRGVTLRDL